LAVIAIYLTLALKRVYQGANGAIVWKAGAVLALALGVNAFASLAAIRLTLALV
jgi:hypothetical protein